MECEEHMECEEPIESCLRDLEVGRQAKLAHRRNELITIHLTPRKGGECGLEA